jgi:hypothetical protein
VPRTYSAEVTDRQKWSGKDAPAEQEGSAMTVFPISGPTAATSRPAAVRRAAGGFDMPTEVAATARAVPPPPVSLDCMLSLQEVEPAFERDRRARRHTEAMLDSLAELQRALLGGGPEADTLGRLAALSRDIPQAADAGLRAVVAAVALRIHVEMARYPRVARQRDAGSQ